MDGTRTADRALPGPWTKTLDTHDAAGHAAWTIRAADGTVVAAQVSGDHDAAWLVAQAPAAR